MLLPLPRRLLRIFDDQEFMEISEDSSFDLTNALLLLRSLQVLDFSESSCIGSFPYFFAEGAAEQFKACTVLGQKQGIDGESF